MITCISWRALRTAVCLAAACLTVAATIAVVAPRFAAAQAAPAAKAEADLKPPATTKAAELFAFVDSIKKTQSASNDKAEQFAYLRKVHEAVIEAVEKVAPDAGEADQVRAIKEKLTSLVMLRRLETAGAAERFDRYLAEVSTDKRPYAPPLAKGYQLRSRLDELDRGDPTAVGKLLADVREYVRSADPDRGNMLLATQVARAAEALGLLQEAADAYIDFAAAFTASDDKHVVVGAERLAGAARLLSAIGKPMDVQGKLLAGGTVDWAKYRGKVVLVDFWATWCGSCIAELPNLREIHSKYHERGFEIVSISLDDDKSRLMSFIEREALEWPVLFDDAAAHAGWEHPLARHYGITVVPRAILVDREGKVVSIAAHGEALWDLLAKQIGPPVVKKPEEGKPEEGKPADGKPGEAKPGEAKPGEAKPAEKPVAPPA